MKLIDENKRKIEKYLRKVLIKSEREAKESSEKKIITYLVKVFFIYERKAKLSQMRTNR